MKIDREQLTSQVDRMKKNGYDYLVKITAVDYSDHVEAIYMLRNLDAGKDESLEVELKNDDLWVPSVMRSYRGADWYERELSEMFGIEIRGRTAERLLLEKWDGANPPLRKDFVWGVQYKAKEE
ncbi:MAG: NADH-quinone oxidoreductase subunit C [Candidatus Micrarchaeota archaeon]|nr:NADH-quinone oxidoreductase subunit C [Candidatus Micrarchaeota archaeon]MDE1824304.1 NADH-quinone oxidoreductase subunit C [Candidatus Micrarchaeota archaeon]MDE1849749.1 NADH-quinone oxidoreductase subunit C [Candidatus Micrarchaeota archaeon]